MKYMSRTKSVDAWFTYTRDDSQLAMPKPSAYGHQKKGHGSPAEWYWWEGRRHSLANLGYLRCIHTVWMQMAQ